LDEGRDVFDLGLEFKVLRMISVYVDVVGSAELLVGVLDLCL
jgi:hypothetical protein